MGQMKSDQPFLSVPSRFRSRKYGFLTTEGDERVEQLRNVSQADNRISLSFGRIAPLTTREE